MVQGRAPAYVKQVIEILLETRAEMRELIKRNVDLHKEVRLLREENLSLREKLAGLETSRATTGDSNVVSKEEFDRKGANKEMEKSIVVLHVPEHPLRNRLLC